MSVPEVHDVLTHVLYRQVPGLAGNIYERRTRRGMQQALANYMLGTPTLFTASALRRAGFDLSFEEEQDNARERERIRSRRRRRRMTIRREDDPFYLELALD